MRPRFVGPDTLAARRRRPSEPQLGRVLSFVGEGIFVAVFTVAGRISIATAAFHCVAQRRTSDLVGFEPSTSELPKTGVIRPARG